MGTYTANYQLYMPTVGENGWGTLINGNFETIDTTMKGLDTRLTAVESEVNGNLSCTSVTTSGTITSSGKITGNGGIAGNLTGNVTGSIYGGTVAGSTGTFSGVITAKNTTKFGGIPYTWYLFGSDVPNGYKYNNIGDSLGGTIQPNDNTNRIIMGSTRVNDGETLTIKSVHGVSSNFLAFVREIKKIDGSWSNPVIKTSSEYVTATISGLNGTITSTGLTITYEQAVALLNSQSTITLKNTHAASHGSYVNASMGIYITNTSSSNQTSYIRLSGLYE